MRAPVYELKRRWSIFAAKNGAERACLGKLVGKLKTKRTLCLPHIETKENRVVQSHLGIIICNEVLNSRAGVGYIARGIGD